MHAQPGTRQSMLACPSWCSVCAWPHRHLARHRLTWKPRRRGNHHSPTSSGRRGTQRKLRQLHPAVPHPWAPWALWSCPQKHRDRGPIRAQKSVPADRYTAYRFEAIAAAAASASAFIMARPPGAGPYCSTRASSPSFPACMAANPNMAVPSGTSPSAPSLPPPTGPTPSPTTGPPLTSARPLRGGGGAGGGAGQLRGGGN